MQGRVRGVAVAALAVSMIVGSCSQQPDQVVRVTQYNDGKGVPLYVSGDAANLAGAPKDFQRFMAGRVRAAIEFDDGSCDEPAVYSVKAVADTGYAAGELSQCGVENIIWVRRANTWTQIWAGTAEPPCKALEQHHVPHGIAGHSCRGDDGSEMYTG